MNPHAYWLRSRPLPLAGLLAVIGAVGAWFAVAHATSTLAAPAATPMVARAGSVIQLAGTVPAGGSVTSATLDLRACRSINVIFDFPSTPASDWQMYVNASLGTFATAVPAQGSWHGFAPGFWATPNVETFLIPNGPAGMTSAPIVTPYGQITVNNGSSAGSVAPSRVDLFCAP